MQRSNDFIWALKDVSFEVKRGERWALLVATGRGKTTLLKILSRITEPTEGYAEIHGRVGSLLEVGTDFHPELTGRENIYLNGAILGMKKAEIDRKFDEIVDFAEIEKFIDTPVKHYSSGMYVRLTFAVAAHLEPEILLEDEVLAVGDAAFQKKCLGKMGDVAREGRTVLFVSHNMTAIKSMCSRCVLMESGGIRLDCESAKIIPIYLSALQPAGRQTRPGEYDLAQRTNSYQPGILVITRMRLLDSRGNLTDTFFMGQEMNITVDICTTLEHRNVKIGAIFKSNTDQWIASITTSMTCSRIDEPRHEKERAILRLARIPFTPGIYRIDISIYEPGSGASRRSVRCTTSPSSVPLAI